MKCPDPGGKTYRMRVPVEQSSAVPVKATASTQKFSVDLLILASLSISAVATAESVARFQFSGEIFDVRFSNIIPLYRNSVAAFDRSTIFREITQF
jgi:hypothetical protein